MSCDEEGEEDSRTEPVLQQRKKVLHLYYNDRSEDSFQIQILFTQMEGKLGEHSYVCIMFIRFL